MLTKIRSQFGIECNVPWDEGNTARLRLAIGILLWHPTVEGRKAYYKQCNLAGLDEGTLSELVEWVLAPTDWINAYTWQVETRRAPVAQVARVRAPTLQLVSTNYGEDCFGNFTEVTPPRR